MPLLSFLSRQPLPCLASALPLRFSRGASVHGTARVSSSSDTAAREQDMGREWERARERDYMYLSLIYISLKIYIRHFFRTWSANTASARLGLRKKRRKSCLSSRFLCVCVLCVCVCVCVCCCCCCVCVCVCVCDCQHYCQQCSHVPRTTL